MGEGRSMRTITQTCDLKDEPPSSYHAVRKPSTRWIRSANACAS
jgi:hypothetical protein